VSSPAHARPESPERRQERQPPSQQEIAEMAYARWQERGSPDGSPEEDWLEAERWLLGEQSSIR